MPCPRRSTVKRVLLLAAAVLAVLGAGGAEARPNLSFDRAERSIQNTDAVPWPILRCNRLGRFTIQCVRRVEAVSEPNDGIQVRICFLTWDRAVQRPRGIRVFDVGDSNRCRL